MLDTPWGEIEVADAHVHFFSHEFFHSLAEPHDVSEVGSRLGWEIPETSEDLAGRWALEMDRHGVDSAVLIGSIPGDVDSVGAALECHPERFRSVAMLNPLLPGADIRCARGMAAGQVNGVFLFPAMHRYSLHDHQVHSLLATVAGYPDTVVYVHCGMLSVGFRKKLGLHSQFDMRFSNPIDLHAVALTFPHLPFVIPHFGAGYLREALMVADLCPNIYFDTSSSNRWIRCEPYTIDLAGVFRKALEVLGPTRLLFGTDSSWFPRGWTGNVFEAQVNALAEAGVDAQGARAILGGNLRR